MDRWNPWHVGLAAVLAAGVYTLARLLGVDPMVALVAAPLAGFISWVILEFWRR